VLLMSQKAHKDGHQPHLDDRGTGGLGTSPGGQAEGKTGQKVQASLSWGQYLLYLGQAAL
jgi:hypothetical protein